MYTAMAILACAGFRPHCFARCSSRRCWRFALSMPRWTHFTWSGCGVYVRGNTRRTQVYAHSWTHVSRHKCIRTQEATFCLEKIEAIKATAFFLTCSSSSTRSSTSRVGAEACCAMKQNSHPKALHTRGLKRCPRVWRPYYGLICWTAQYTHRLLPPEHLGNMTSSCTKFL